MFTEGREKRGQKRDWKNSAWFVDREGTVGNSWKKSNEPNKNNTADINDENVDVVHAHSANEEPFRLIENDLSDSERDRLLRLREALEGDDFGKTEMNLNYEDKEKIDEEVIKINKVLEHVKITGLTHCRNVQQVAMKIVGEEVGMNKQMQKRKRNHSGKEGSWEISLDYGRT